MAQIFISYSSKDRDKATVLAAAFEDFGHIVWWDFQLKGGDDFRDQIDEHIAKANAVVVLLTENSLASIWVNAEALAGLKRQALVPVRYSKDITPPKEFNNLHAEYLGDWDGTPRSKPINNLVEQIAQMKDAQDRADLVETLPFGLGSFLAKSSLFRTMFDLSLLGSLRVHTLMAGSFVGALALWGVLFLINLVVPSTNYTADIVGFLVLFTVLMVSRIMDQIIVVSKGESSDRFFDRSFSFSMIVCGLLGLIGSLSFVLIEHLSSVGGSSLYDVVFVMIAIGVLLLIVSYTLRAIIVGAIFLNRRIR